LVNGHNGDIIQLTADHSFVQALVDAGHITAEEAEEHPMKNVLYRALGQGDSIEVDVHTDLKLHTGDRIVLCSDGLTLHVRAHEIADIVMEEDDPDICSQRLIDLANSRGGRDNISVIVIYADKETPARNSSHEEESDTRPAPLFKNDEEATLFLRERQLKPTPTKESDEPRNQYVEVTTSETDGEGHDWLNTS
jgi:serine/threonine protein phosphatase PrpC